MRTTYGSPLFAEHVPEADSLLVERLRAAGAIVIGKTNTPEFGAGSQTFNAVFGATRNPWDLSRTPGGSSGGAAAAVASGMLPFADGSTSAPASATRPRSAARWACGPRPGLIPDAGPGDPWNPLPVLGPIARTVDDVALLLSGRSRAPIRATRFGRRRVRARLRTASCAGCGSAGAATSAACRSTGR